jgi:hypothetical protein
LQSWMQFIATCVQNPTLTLTLNPNPNPNSDP